MLLSGQGIVHEFEFQHFKAFEMIFHQSNVYRPHFGGKQLGWLFNNGKVFSTINKLKQANSKQMALTSYNNTV